MKRADAKEDGPGASRGKTLSVCVVLAFLCLVVYGQVIRYDFLNFDDDRFVTENPQVQSGLTWAGIQWAFTSKQEAYLIPLSWLSHMVDCRLFGLKPWGHHLTNLLFHMANCVLLFLVLRYVTGTLWRSALVALLFAAHPLNVETVAWISERKNVLSTFFWFLCMGSYAWYARSPRAGRYVLTLALFCSGLLAKPMLVTLPCVFVLMDVWPLGRYTCPENTSVRVSRVLSLLLEKTPFLAVSLGLSLTTIWMQRFSGGPRVITALRERITTALVAYIVYLEKAFWPANLVMFYPRTMAVKPGWWIGAAVLLLLGVSVAVLAKRRLPYLAVGWFWYLGTLVPVLGIVQFASYAYADRYTYVPMIGIFIMAAWGLADLVDGKPLPTKLAVAASCLVLAGLSAGSLVQARYWKNSLALSEHALQVTPDNEVAHNNLGAALLAEGRQSEAIPHYEAALRLNPGSANAHNNIGNYLRDTGQFDGAISHYRQAIALNPHYAKPFNNLGLVLADLGRHEEAITNYTTALQMDPGYLAARADRAASLAALKRYPEAEQDYQNILRSNPLDRNACSGLALLYAMQGRLAESKTYWERVLQEMPDDANAHNNLANILSAMGKTDDAERYYRQAIKINPGLTSAYSNLAVLLALHGKLSEAVTVYDVGLKSQKGENAIPPTLGAKLESLGKEEAAVAEYKALLAKRPDDISARLALARLLAMRGDVAGAEQHYEEVVKRSPSNRDAHFDLAVLLEVQGKRDEAVDHYSKALELDPADAKVRARLIHIQGTGTQAP